MSKWVLDASAILAYLLEEEPGFHEVAGRLNTAAVSTVNVAEVASKLGEKGANVEVVRGVVEGLNVEIIGFDRALSYRVGDLRGATKQWGLSLGDRACLATAERLGVPAVTTDPNWALLSVGVEIQVIR